MGVCKFGSLTSLKRAFSAFIAKNVKKTKYGDCAEGGGVYWKGRLLGVLRYSFVSYLILSKTQKFDHSVVIDPSPHDSPNALSTFV